MPPSTDATPPAGPPDLSALRRGFLMFPAFEVLDLVSPWEVATMWWANASGPQCATVAGQRAEIRCARGLRVSPEHDFDSVGALDHLLMPGGFAAVDEAKNPRMPAFVRAVAARSRAVLSVCSGSFIPQAAGLLAGWRATSHWKALAALRALGVDVVEDRCVQDGVL